jgi:intracellular sulfur oxidation DsrE/DsrF family protein
MSTQQGSTRRSFLGRFAAGAALVGLGGRSAAAEIIGHGDSSEGFSEAWLGKLNGKHKQFFDATSVNNGFGLVFAMNFLNSNNDAYKLADNSLSAVVGLRHFAIPIAFTDDIWARYKLGEFAGVTDPVTKAPATRNLFFHSRDGDVMFPASSVDKLLARGVQITCCNVALTVLSGKLAGNAGKTPDEARKEWLAGMIPGVVLVPSGVLAVNRAQEKQCTYCNGG